MPAASGRPWQPQSDRDGRQAKFQGGARAPRVSSHPLARPKGGTKAGAANAVSRRGPASTGRQARPAPWLSSGVTFAATTRLRHSISVVPEGDPAVFCTLWRSTFAAALAATGAESVDINNKRQVSAVQRRQKARRNGRSCCLDAAKRPASRYCRPCWRFLHPDNTLAGSALSTRKHETFPKLYRFAAVEGSFFFATAKTAFVSRSGSA